MVYIDGLICVIYDIPQAENPSGFEPIVPPINVKQITDPIQKAMNLISKKYCAEIFICASLEQDVNQTGFYYKVSLGRNDKKREIDGLVKKVLTEFLNEVDLKPKPGAGPKELREMIKDYQSKPKPL